MGVDRHLQSAASLKHIEPNCRQPETIIHSVPHVIRRAIEADIPIEGATSERLQ